MRRSILSILCLALAGPVLGQGYFAFNNRWPGLVDAPVFDALGNRLSGPDYLASLYVGPTPDSLQPVVRDTGGYPVATQPFQTGQLAGYIVGESVAASNVAGGALVWVQMRAWDASLGGTYEEAVQAGLGGYGESGLFEARAGLVEGAGTRCEFLVGLESFSLRSVIREPSALNLLLLAAPVLWLANRQRIKPDSHNQPKPQR
jgi:hypothetical protein